MRGACQVAPVGTLLRTPWPASNHPSQAFRPGARSTHALSAMVSAPPSPEGLRKANDALLIADRLCGVEVPHEWSPFPLRVALCADDLDASEPLWSRTRGVVGLCAPPGGTAPAPGLGTVRR